MDKKEYIDTLCNLIVGHFGNIEQHLLENIDNKLALGVAGIHISSILELYQSTTQLLDEGFIESAGATATSLWERSVTLQFMLSDMNQYIPVFPSAR